MTKPFSIIGPDWIAVANHNEIKYNGEDIKRIFEAIVDEVDPKESLPPEGALPRMGGYLIIAREKQSQNPNFLVEGVFPLGKLQEHQVYQPTQFGSDISEDKTKVKTYLDAAFGKISNIITNPNDSRESLKSKRLEIGAVRLPGTDIIFSFSGFNGDKDEAFVLTLLIYSKLITLEDALELARKHENDLFTDEFYSRVISKIS